MTTTTIETFYGSYYYNRLIPVGAIYKEEWCGKSFGPSVFSVFLVLQIEFFLALESMETLRTWKRIMYSTLNLTILWESMFTPIIHNSRVLYLKFL